MSELLPTNFRTAIPFLSPYLLTSFGSFTRMDYGTGHETSFALLLLCLTLVRFFEPEPVCERQLVLTLFVRYLRLCWRIQDVYNLEPAGSHGVWGLDDYNFLGYIFGSAQLRGRYAIIQMGRLSGSADVCQRPDRGSRECYPSSFFAPNKSLFLVHLSHSPSETWPLP